ncbi:hypothetical protein VQZ80_001632 [Salmonella enterica]|nr:hypothetical protein [Salmonella enterica]EKC2306312.1 hypothetical protein [Salmonella enterica]EKC2386025.1 hypothetical protein [Salmonella enterica]EKC2531285.1 hypothetical protein [Salmonella enterica]EKC2984487.1 hypothetical protein [Salmonella enterica]
MQARNIFYVYIHRFADGTIYIGAGSGRRAYQSAKTRHNSHWNKLFQDLGSPKIRILKKELTQDDALALEMILINRLKEKGKPICNITLGGRGGLGMPVSDETRKLLSIANSGEKNSMFGRQHTEEVRRTVGEKNKGRYLGEKSSLYKHTEYHLIHESGITFTGTQWHFSNDYGISQSAASMLCAGKIDSIHGWRLFSTPIESIGKKGNRHGRYDHAKYHFRHDSGVEEICTKHELCEKYKLPSPSNIYNVCSGRIPSYKGWRLIRC